MRIPVALSAAAALAVDELGLARSTTSLTADALRTTLEAAVLRAALDQHYDEHPDIASRPGRRGGGGRATRRTPAGGDAPT